jgi:hypothetical protein
VSLCSTALSRNTGFRRLIKDPPGCTELCLLEPLAPGPGALEVGQVASGCQRGGDDRIAQALVGVFRADPIVIDLFDAIGLGLQLTNRQDLDMLQKIGQKHRRALDHKARMPPERLYWAAKAEQLGFELRFLPRPRDFQGWEDYADLGPYLPQRKGEGKRYMNPSGTMSDRDKLASWARGALGNEKVTSDK